MNLSFRPSLTRAGPILILLAAVDSVCLVLGLAILSSRKPEFSGIVLTVVGLGVPVALGLFFSLTRVFITEDEIGYRNLFGMTTRVARARLRGADQGFAPQPAIFFRDLSGHVVFKINTKLWRSADVSAILAAVGSESSSAH